MMTEMRIYDNLVGVIDSIDVATAEFLFNAWMFMNNVSIVQYDGCTAAVPDIFSMDAVIRQINQRGKPFLLLKLL